MKMVKSLLLGSAAGVVAVAGAQAADLPVKAKAVEYVKICSLYGAGFYYIPGTDICMKVGGVVRWQETWANGMNTSSGGPFNGTGGRANRVDSTDLIQRTRAVATFDTRQQTQYGVLRTYALLGFQQDSSAAPSTAPAVYMTRGFMQFAGFTFGKATSYFDFFGTAPVSYNAGMLHAPDTGDAGQMVAAYTAMFGGGTSVSVALEQTRRAATVNTAITGSYVLGAAGPIADNLGQLAAPVANNSIGGIPDIVANIRWEGTWGAVQLAGAMHNVSAGYYGTSAAGAVTGNGHPGEKWGWAISPGLRINAPMFGPGDYFQAAYHLAQGAVKYTGGATPTGNSYLKYSGGSLGWGFWEDGVFTTGGGIELTSSWSVAASYEHFWTPALQTSIYGSYSKVTHNSTATALICGSGTAATIPFSATTCNPDWSTWNIGSRTQWNIVKGLYVGLDVIYTKLNTAQANNLGTVVLAAQGQQGASNPTQPHTVSDQSAWLATFRVHRDIVP